MSLRREVLSLYKEAFNYARKLPHPEKREIALRTIRQYFRENEHEKDEIIIQVLKD